MRYILSGTIVTDRSGGGKFSMVTLNPTLILRDINMSAYTIDEIHAQAHKLCFIANSLNFKIDINSKIIKNQP